MTILIISGNLKHTIFSQYAIPLNSIVIQQNIEILFFLFETEEE